MWKCENVANGNIQFQLANGNIGNWQHFHIGNIVIPFVFVSIAEMRLVCYNSPIAAVGGSQEEIMTDWRKRI